MCFDSFCMQNVPQNQFKLSRNFGFSQTVYSQQIKTPIKFKLALRYILDTKRIKAHHYLKIEFNFRCKK